MGDDLEIRLSSGQRKLELGLGLSLAIVIFLMLHYKRFIFCAEHVSVLACSGERGTGECCTRESPCKVGGGDCDKDEDCAGDLVCGKNNCQDFNWLARSSYDCCIKHDN